MVVLLKGKGRGNLDPRFGSVDAHYFLTLGKGDEGSSSRDEKHLSRESIIRVCFLGKLPIL